MYFEFDFNRDADFFEQSSTMKFMKEKLAENKHLKKIDPQVYHASIKLWGESIIKHNLDINMTRVEHLNLISEQNSKEVLDTIGNIMFKDKHDRTDAEFKVLRDQGMVANYLQLITLSVEEDVCNNLKKEFIEYHNPQKTPKP
jgi:hypothetical protein